MAQEIFEGYISQHKGSIIDAVVEWGKRITDVDVRDDHDKLAKVISDLTKAIEDYNKYQQMLTGPKGVIREFQYNTYMETENAEGELYIRNFNTDEYATVFAGDYVARQSGEPEHRLSKKANLEDVSNLSKQISAFNGMKDISIEDIDCGLDNTPITKTIYPLKVSEIAGVYRVMSAKAPTGVFFPIDKIPYPIGILYVFGTGNKQDILQCYFSTTNPDTGEYSYPRMFTRQHRTDTTGSSAIWTEWSSETEDYEDRIAALEEKVLKLDNNFTLNRTTLEALQTYDKVVNDKEWNRTEVGAPDDGSGMIKQ